jgi:hypothetical protein
MTYIGTINSHLSLKKRVFAENGLGNDFYENFTFHRFLIGRQVGSSRVHTTHVVVTMIGLLKGAFLADSLSYTSIQNLSRH